VSHAALCRTPSVEMNVSQKPMSERTEVLLLVELDDPRTQWTFRAEHPVNVTREVNRISRFLYTKEESEDLVEGIALAPLELARGMVAH